MAILGYTTGVYDLFHIGHLNLLKNAAAQCDRLIVGVTTDELALARKGKRPVIPFEERFAIVGALRCVDEVVAQTDMDKYAAWERLRFDRMFVGDDWKGHPKWSLMERRFALHGVEIVYFPYTHHVSSSHLRHVIEDTGFLDQAGASLA